MDRLVNNYVSAFYGWCRLTGADPQNMSKMDIYNRILYLARGAMEPTPYNLLRIKEYNHGAANLALTRILAELQTNEKVKPLMPAVYKKKNQKS